MSIKKLRAGRVPTVTAEQYVGEIGSIFWNESSGELRLSDGVTLGGHPLPITIASSTTVGGIKAGPGIVISADGTLLIDSEGLEFAFGDFTSVVGQYDDLTDYALLGSIKTDEDIVIASNGIGTVKVVGGFAVYKTDGTYTEALNIDPVFQVSEIGKITAATLDITNTADLDFTAPLNVSINAAGLTKVPSVISGAVAQFTGRDDRQPAVVIDAYGVDGGQTMTGGKVVFRTGRGTNASTTAVQSGDRLGTFAAAGWASNGYAGIDSGSIIIRATENFTTTARGASVEIRAVATGTLTPTSIATFDAITGVTSATGFVAATNYKGNSRNAGTLTAGATLTIDYATDHHVFANITGAITIAHTNIVAGRNVKVILLNATGGNWQVDAGVIDINVTGNDATTNLNSNRMGAYEFVSFGTTTATIYANINK